MSQFPQKVANYLFSISKYGYPMYGEHLFCHIQNGERSSYYMVYCLSKDIDEDGDGSYKVAEDSDSTYLNMIRTLREDLTHHTASAHYVFSQYEADGMEAGEFASSIIKCEPTPEELVHFYQLTSFGHPFALPVLLEQIPQDAKWREHVKSLFCAGATYQADTSLLNANGGSATTVLSCSLTDMVRVLKQHEFSSEEMADMLIQHANHSKNFAHVLQHTILYAIGQLIAPEDQEKVAQAFLGESFKLRSLYQESNHPTVSFKITGENLKLDYGFQNNYSIQECADSIEELLDKKELLTMLGLEEAHLSYSFKKDEVFVCLVSQDSQPVNTELAKEILTHAFKLGEQFSVQKKQNPKMMDDIVLYATLNRNMDKKDIKNKKMKL